MSVQALKDELVRHVDVEKPESFNRLHRSSKA